MKSQSFSSSMALTRQLVHRWQASEWVEKRQRRVTVGRPKKSLGRKILQGSPREGDPMRTPGAVSCNFLPHACGASLAYDF
jgi:hypothetical protein